MSGSSDISYWDVKVYHLGDEKETFRTLSWTHMDRLMEVFDREGVPAQAIPYTEDGERVQGEAVSVNSAQINV